MAVFGEPKQRALLLVVVVPVFAVLFWLLRRKFLAARQARVARLRAAPRGALAAARRAGSAADARAAARATGRRLRAARRAARPAAAACRPATTGRTA